MLTRLNQNAMRIFIFLSFAVLCGSFFWFFNPKVPFLLFLALFLAFEVIFFFVYFRFFQNLFVKELTRNLSIYQNDCDPRPALNSCVWQLAASGRRNQNADYCRILQLNRATLLAELGQYDDASAAFDTLLRHLTPDDPLLPCCRRNQLPLLFHRKQFSEIEALIHELEQSSAATRPEGEHEWFVLLREICAFLQYRQQNDDMEKQLQTFLHAAPRKLDQVKFSFLLGEYYLALNQPEQAQLHLQFVVENGNALAIAGEAHALLDRL